jgi:hypothetical protein
MFFLMLCCMFSAMTVQAAQNCKPDSIPASTPDSQLIDNGDGTITDSKTGLMWKKCLEGVSGASCETGLMSTFYWQDALKQSGIVNREGGFAGYTDWRLPNINELDSIVEEQCFYPAINLSRFPNTPSLGVWSGSPYADNSDYAWNVDFRFGFLFHYRGSSCGVAVRLVRGGQ